MAHRQFHIIAWVGMALLLQACPFQSKKSKMKISTAESCATNPMTWDKRGLYRFKFGPKDAVFRQEVKKIVDQYVETGNDLQGKDAIAFTTKYLPQYMRNCSKYWDAVVEQCADHLDHDARFKSCWEPLAHEWSELVAYFFATEEKANSIVDLERFNLDDVSRGLRREKYGVAH